MTPKDGWDPEHPDLKYATGVPKKQGGWKTWVAAGLIIAAMLTVWKLTR
mgnify:CR=1 FL=1